MDEQHSPLFSVIIATYNRSWAIERAIESVFAQTERSWELIIVDDGSTDDTLVRIQPYALAAQNVYVVVQANHGTGAARATGIRLARGEFITFLDSDDTYLPEHLAVRKQYIADYPTCDFFHGGVIVIGDRFVPDRFDPQRRIPIEECAVGGTFVIRRQVALQLGFAPLRYADDADFFDRARRAGIEPVYVPVPTYCYNRTSPDSLCTQLALSAYKTSSTSPSTYQ
ncbi:MAG: glycosyltransferase family 2 protein [Chlorobi bacterium]|nr:glycosyltransferase family 2 protein [Chlorobiota bacterium]